MAHIAIVYSFLQLRIAIIFSIRGEESFVPPNTKIFKAITNKQFPFEMTVSFRLESDRKGKSICPTRSRTRGGRSREHLPQRRPDQRRGRRGPRAVGLRTACREARPAAGGPKDQDEPEARRPLVPIASGPKTGSTRDRLFAAAREAAKKGYVWRIRQMLGLSRIVIEALEPDAGWALLDLSQADLDAYTERAADWLRPDMDISNAEVLA